MAASVLSSCLRARQTPGVRSPRPTKHIPSHCLSCHKMLHTPYTYPKYPGLSLLICRFETGIGAHLLSPSSLLLTQKWHETSLPGPCWQFPRFPNVSCQGAHGHLKQKFQFWVELRLKAWYTKKFHLKCPTDYSIYRLNLIHTSPFTLKQHSVAILQPWWSSRQLQYKDELWNHKKT